MIHYFSVTLPDGPSKWY